MIAYSTINLNDLRVVRENEQMIIAYCPFHNDKSRPNLQVDKTGPYAGRFICWACGAKGAVKGLHIEHKEPRVVVSVEWEMLSHIYRTHLTKAALSRLMNYWSLHVLMAPDQCKLIHQPGEHVLSSDQLLSGRQLF